MPTDYEAIFGANLDRLIQQRNWSIQFAAKELGYSRNDLALLVTGRKHFKLNTAVKIAKYFHISVFLFFTRVFDNESYRMNFPFVEEDYVKVIAKNFRDLSVKQASIDMDKSSASQILRAHRSNITVETAAKIADGAEITLGELLMTAADKEIKKRLEEDRK